MNQKQKVALKMGAWFLCVLLILTFLSKTIDTMLLPKVDTVGVVAGSIGEQYFANGTIEVDAIEVTLPYDCTILENYANVGNSKEEGEDVLLIESEDQGMTQMEQDLALLQAENAVRNLEQQIAGSGNTGTSSGTAIANLQDQLAAQELKYENLKEKYPYCGYYATKQDGYFRTLNYGVGDLVPQGKVVAETAQTDIGGVIRPNSVQQVTAPFDLTVTEVPISEGSFIKTGDILFRFTAPEIDLALKEQENVIRSLERQIADASEEPESGTSVATLQRQLEEARLRLQLERERVRLGTGSLQGNIVTMPSAGTLLHVAMGEVKAGEALLRFYEVENVYELHFLLNAQTAGQMVIGKSKVRAMVRGQRLDDNRAVSVEGSFLVEQIAYDEAAGKYRCVASGEVEDVKLQPGASVSLTIQGTSAAYDMIVPRTCVTKDSEGKSWVYLVEESAGLFGTEYRLKKEDVTVLDEDSVNVAISPSGWVPARETKVVAGTMVALEDNMRVKLR